MFTYQTLVDDAEHEHVVQDDVSWVFGVEGDVCDGRVPLQPQRVQSLFLQLPAPVCVLLLHQGVLKDLQHTTENTHCDETCRVYVSQYYL